MPDSVLDQFIRQAEDSERLGSPFMANLCRLLAGKLDRRSRFGTRILEWPGDAYEDRLALRTCGALHAAARSREPALRQAYPPAPFDQVRLSAAVDAAIQTHDDFLTAYLDSPPQTNEVARSALILGGMLHIASRVRCPLDIYEIGASAGLNLGFDAYRYDLGDGRTWGPPQSPLTITSDWRGALPPLDAPLAVAGRHACDRNPLDPANAADAERLVSYIWPDQLHRIARLEAALKLAAQAGHEIERLDAADWLEQHWRDSARPGTCRVLFHTSVWDYLAAETRTRIEATLARAGAAATNETPVAWFSAEPDGTGNGDPLRLVLWPGEVTHHLGRGQPHGGWAEWVQ